MPSRYIQKCQTYIHVYTKISNTVVHLSIYDIFVSGILCCVCLYTHKSRLTNGLLGHLIGWVNCDVTGPLWHHQKAVSCLRLGWIDRRHPALVLYTRVYETNRMQTSGACLIHPGVWDKTILWLSGLHIRISFTGKTSFYWIGALYIPWCACWGGSSATWFSGELQWGSAELDLVLNWFAKFYV